MHSIIFGILHYNQYQEANHANDAQSHDDLYLAVPPVQDPLQLFRILLEFAGVVYFMLLLLFIFSAFSLI